MAGIRRGPIKTGCASPQCTGDHNPAHEDHDMMRQSSAGDPAHIFELDPILADPRPEPR